MDSIHDLGGKQGYGPIELDDETEVFHEDWEGREWGISRCARTPGITIDWWRHCRELIMPLDYLSRPYFDSWAQTDFSTYIEAGWITFDEIDAGKSLNNDIDYGEAPAPRSLQQVLDDDRARAVRFDASIDTPPVFSEGQRVLTVKHGHTGHTRLPQYARGRMGTIHAYNGAHVFPDRSVEGKEVHQHCYNVVFAAADLWPEANGRRDSVHLDLWESYLEEL